MWRVSLFREARRRCFFSFVLFPCLSARTTDRPRVISPNHGSRPARRGRRVLEAPPRKLIACFASTPQAMVGFSPPTPPSAVEYQGALAATARRLEPAQTTLANGICCGSTAAPPTFSSPACPRTGYYVWREPAKSTADDPPI